jgi:uncharacterized protein with GYD domain
MEGLRECAALFFVSQWPSIHGYRADVYLAPPVQSGGKIPERGHRMPSYLLQVSYSPATIAAFIKRPQNRAEIVRKPIEKLGGSIGGFWLAFGDYDVIAIIDMPDNVSAAAFALAISGGGACKSVKTTPLLSIDEGLEAMKKAGSAGYKPITGAK